MNATTPEAGRENRAKIRELIEKNPDITGAQIAAKLGLAVSTACKHKSAIEEENTIPKEKRMVRKKADDNEGGAANADEDALQRLVEWHEQREKELLEHVAVLSSRLVKSLERIEDLEAAATPAAE